MGHAEAVKDSGLHLLAYVQPETLLESELKDVETFTGIAVAPARIMVESQPLVRFEPPEVGKAGGVGQKNSWSQSPPTLITRQVGEFSILGQGAGQQLGH